MKRFKDDFNVPSAIFLEPIPETPLRILLFLFSESKTHGECDPGHAKISRHTFLTENTIRSGLKWLKRKGWISHTRRQAHPKNMLIYVRIPPRLRPATPVNVIEAKERQFKVL